MSLSKNKRRKTNKSKKKSISSNYRDKKRYVKRRNDIYGVLIIMFSLLLFISMYGFSDSGLINKPVNDFLSLVFGVGKFLIPLMLIVWGFSFFLKRLSLLPSSFGLGFLLLFFSILGLLGNNFKYVDVFDRVLVKTRGGIVGAGIFYGLYKLFSSAGAVVILSVLIIISILIITKVSLIDVGKKIVHLFGRIKPGTVRNIFRKRNLDEDTMSIKEEEKYRNRLYGDKGEKTSDREGKAAGGRKEKAEGGFDTPVEFMKKYKTKKSDSSQLKIPIKRSYGIEDSYRLPPINLLKKSRDVPPRLYKQGVKERANTLSKLLRDFNLDARIEKIVNGPTVTLYELKLQPGVKVQRLLSLEDDFCVALGSPDIRILTPIPGKSAIGIEVPNSIRSIVTLGDIFTADDKNITENLLNVPLGKNLSGRNVYMDIGKMPHILIAGATNSGKSSCLNSIIISLLMKIKPGEARFVMIDPKMVELSIYNGIPHLLSPVVVNPKKASSTLSWVVEEMERRFKLLVERNFKSLEMYNSEASKNGNGEEGFEPLPYIMVFIDELADLMMVSASEVEDRICRIAQMGRAVGIHLIISTQRPSVNIITGLIKANIPSRIAFMVTSNVDSRVILDCGGAEKLIGKGDMLYLPYYSNRPERVQGSFVTSHEIEMITGYIKNNSITEYNAEISKKISGEQKSSKNKDELFYEALRVVVDFGHASASLLQRRLKIGYSRAARIIDQMEERGLVSGYDGSKPREVLISKEDLIKLLEEEDSQ
ncbi:MAG: DNA translocase FtsK 4TM domain-containing protein [Actinomycetota bacterium]|nr:DNA translocase FtsK 4TM domain-containing protein [Actinomycetota bacterium]